MLFHQHYIIEWSFKNVHLLFFLNKLPVIHKLDISVSELINY